MLPSIFACVLTIQPDTQANFNNALWEYPNGGLQGFQSSHVIEHRPALIIGGALLMEWSGLLSMRLLLISCRLLK